MRGRIPPHQLDGRTPAEHVRGEVAVAHVMLDDLKNKIAVAAGQVGRIARHVEDTDSQGLIRDPDEHEEDARAAVRSLERAARDLQRILITWTQLTHDPRFGDR